VQIVDFNFGRDYRPLEDQKQSSKKNNWETFFPILRNFLHRVTDQNPWLAIIML
jgi:hypothetical protein